MESIEKDQGSWLMGLRLRGWKEWQVGMALGYVPRLCVVAFVELEFYLYDLCLVLGYV